MIILSRSAIDTYKACAQKFYLQYLYNEHGVVESKSDLDMTIGSAIHLFFETIYKANLGDNHDHSKELMELSIEKALNYFNETVTRNPLNLKSFEKLGDEERIIDEHLALIEALCYTYWVNKFEEHHRRFKFLEVEQEQIIRLGKFVINNVEEDVFYVLKADGLWLERETNNLYVLSNKVISGYLAVTARNYSVSSQNVSELWGINHKINEFINLIKNQGINDYKDVLEEYLLNEYKTNRSPKANYVYYNLLIKGQRREEPYQSGIYRRNSVLIRPYKFEPAKNVNPFNRFRTEDSEVNVDDLNNYKLTVGSGRPPKDWHRIEIWKDIGVRNFINAIKRGLVQPEDGNYLDQITREADDDLFKTDDEIELFKERLYYSVFNDILPKLKVLKEGEVNPLIVFDINTHNCFDFYGKDCAFVEYCHGNQDVENDLNLNLMQIRRPHHTLEEELFIRKGFINNE